MILHACEQRTPEWHRIRNACLLTASEAGVFLDPAKNDKRSIESRRKRVMRYLARECYYGGDARLLDLKEKEAKAMEFNLAVQRGNAFEQEAREAFAKTSGLRVDEIGIITTDDGLFGGSPDGLIGEREGFEAKVPLPETHLGYIIEHHETGGMIDDYLWQVHMNLAISERDAWHFWSYSVPYESDGRWLQHPPLWIEVKANAVTEKVRKGLDILRQEHDRIRDMLASHTPTAREAQEG